jgi:hypothetical protein
LRPLKQAWRPDRLAAIMPFSRGFHRKANDQKYNKRLKINHKEAVSVSKYDP